MQLELDPHHPQRTLVDQIVQGIRAAVDNHSLPPGTRLPSVRKPASCRRARPGAERGPLLAIQFRAA
ncbi:hypothetical protein, partial [Ralstonia pseudosolanacearum]|uniref:hypothetical protein n=1 Tax=Ralstonia pseudosolanacearum TaxID=1310165 RepID=UPI003221BF4F